jgi:hypothetical protein
MDDLPFFHREILTRRQYQFSYSIRAAYKFINTRLLLKNNGDLPFGKSPLNKKQKTKR